MKFNFLTVFEIFFKLKCSKFIQDIRTLERFGRFLLIVRAVGTGEGERGRRATPLQILEYISINPISIRGVTSEGGADYPRHITIQPPLPPTPDFGTFLRPCRSIFFGSTIYHSICYQNEK